MGRAKYQAEQIFPILWEAEVEIGKGMSVREWRVHYNTERPHSSLGYRPPAPDTILPLLPAPLRYAGSREV